MAPLFFGLAAHGLCIRLGRHGPLMRLSPVGPRFVPTTFDILAGPVIQSGRSSNLIPRPAAISVRALRIRLTNSG
jgi:hypothetical protein